MPLLYPDQSRVVSSENIIGRSALSTRGFALVLALSLMSFILLILIGFVAVTNVEVSSSAQNRRLMEARQNAYLAVMVAMGELQKVAGPDQRVSARADIFTGTNGISEASMENGYWMGVWPSDLSGWDSMSMQARLDAAWWVVSGNEGLQPGDSGYRTPEDTLSPDSVEMAPAIDAYNVKAVSVPTVARQQLAH